MRREVEETLNRLRLKKKYSCVVITNPKEDEMIKKVKDFIAFGEINSSMFEKLLEKEHNLLTR